jgi:putative ABC transport system ATP-binding protein
MKWRAGNMKPNLKVDVKDVSKKYLLGKAVIPALNRVSLTIVQNDFLVISGASGSGKTTLLNLIGLIDTVTSGEIWMNSENVTSDKANHLYRYRRDKLGYIFQTFNLIPVLNVYENVEYPLILKGISREQRKERIETVLEKLGLMDRCKHRPRELSGGQRQRVSIARALVKNPEIILADEPTANLDSKTGLEIIELMERLNQEEGIAFVFSTHDPLIIQKGRRNVQLRDGRIESIQENGGSGYDIS